MASLNTDSVEARVEAILPNPANRTLQLSIFAETIWHLDGLDSSAWLIHLRRDRIRLLFGRLIVMTLKDDGIWIPTDASRDISILSHLPSWEWDDNSYPEYRKPKSRNGYYRPGVDRGRGWSVILEFYHSYLAMLRGRSIDLRSAARHEPGVLLYLRGVLQQELPDPCLDEFAASSQATPPTFRQAEVFPIVARIIANAPADETGYVLHETIVSALLADRDAEPVLMQATESSSLSDRRRVASNMVAWFSQQITVGRSRWSEFFEREQRNGGWAYRPRTALPPPIAADAELSAIEGDPRLYFHIRRERDSRIVGAKRAAARASNRRLQCEACGFSTDDIFPALDGEVCEIHHRLPLGMSPEATETRLEDLAVLCANCHKAIHRTRPMLSVDEFRERYFGNETIGTAGTAVQK